MKWSIAFFTLCTWSFYLNAQSPALEPAPGPIVIPLLLETPTAVDRDWQRGEALWLEVDYLAAPQGEPVFQEVTEQVFWVGEKPMLMLGGSGRSLPEYLLSRGVAWVRIFEAGEAVGEDPLQIFPRRQRMRLSSDSDAMKTSLAKMLPGVDAAYLAQVANFLAGHVANLDVLGTSYGISGFGQVISSAGEWTGQPVTNPQNLFAVVQGDMGSTTADAQADILTIAGSGIVSTAISGDTLTVSVEEADDDATNELQDLFATIQADAGSTTADAQADALNIIGTGIVSTSITGDTVTLMATEEDGDATNEIQDLFASFTSDSGSLTATNQATGMLVTGAGAVTTSASGNTLTITGTALTAEVDGSTTNELQNLFSTVTSDAGSTIADNLNDVLTIVGSGSVSTAIKGDTLTITSSALTTEADGSTSNELQNLFATVQADTGQTTANDLSDSLAVAGSGLISTSIAADTLTIDGSIGDDSLDFPHLADAMTLDATTTVDMDTHNADLDLDAQTFFLDASTNRIGLRTDTPRQALHIEEGDILQTPGNLIEASRVGVSQTPIGLAVSGRYAYVADFLDDDLTVVDVTVPSSPEVMGSLQLPGAILKLVVSGHYVYIGNTEDDLIHVVDVADPSHPTLVSSIDMSSGVKNLDVAGHYLYVPREGPSDFKIVDVVDPTKPRTVGTAPLDDGSKSIHVVGQFAYIVTEGGLSTDSDLRVFDISNPTTPTQVGSVIVGNNNDIRDIHVSGRYAYVSDRSGSKLIIIDVADPTDPMIVSSNDGLTSAGTNIFVSGNYLYLAGATSDRVRVIDIADPTAPFIVDAINLGADVSDVFVSGQYVYAARDGGSGHLVVTKVPGAEFSGVTAHAMEVGSAQVRDDITAQGQLRVTSGLEVGGNALVQGDFGVSGKASILGVASFFSTSQPTTSPPDRIQLFGQDVGGSSELRVRDEAGNTTTISPHNFSLIGAASELLAWSYYSETNHGRINVDMLRTVRLVEQMSGEALVHLEGMDPSDPQTTTSLYQQLKALELENRELETSNRHLGEELAKIKTVLGLENSGGH